MASRSSENAIADNWTVGVLFLDASGGTNVPVQQAQNSAFTNNDISGNWYGQVVDRQSGGSLPAPGTTNLKNFSGNWLGTVAPVFTSANSAEPGYATQIPVAFGGSAVPPGGQPDIAGPASENIDFTPWLASGTDTDLLTLGFQGGHSTLHVGPDGAQTGSAGRIQEAVDMVSGSTVLVHAGTYVEDVDLDVLNLQLIGDDALTTIVSGPGGNLDNYTLDVLANGVLIQGLTVTREGNAAATWDSDLNLAGVHIAGNTGLELRQSILRGNRSGLRVEGGSDINVHHNRITDNRTGVQVYGAPNSLHVDHNEITNNWALGVIWMGDPDAAVTGTRFTDNNISGNWYAQVQNLASVPTLDFSGNWLGTTTPTATVALAGEPGYSGLVPAAFGGVGPSSVPPLAETATITGPGSVDVDFTPWLDSATDGDAGLGFAGTYSTLHVGPDGRPDGLHRPHPGRPSTRSSGSTVLVHAGTYVEDVDLDVLNLQLIGDDALTTIGSARRQSRQLHPRRPRQRRPHPGPHRHPRGQRRGHLGQRPQPRGRPHRRQHGPRAAREHPARQPLGPPGRGRLRHQRPSQPDHRQPHRRPGLRRAEQPARRPQRDHQQLGAGCHLDG